MIYDIMLNLETCVGKKVNIECYDGDKYEKYYVYGFTIWYNNDDREEDSIDIMVNENSGSGITLYASEIKDIEII